MSDAAQRLDALTEALAECGRLREQLGAAEDALRKILGPDPSWDADAQHDYGFRYDGPFPPAWVRDIANDALVARAALGVEGEQEKP